MKQPKNYERPTNPGDLVLLKMFYPNMDITGKYMYLMVIFDIVGQCIWFRRLKENNSRKILKHLERFNNAFNIQNIVLIEQDPRIRHSITRLLLGAGYSFSPVDKSERIRRATIDIDFYVKKYLDTAKHNWAEQIYVFNEFVNRDLNLIKTGRIQVPEEEYNTE